MLPETQPAEGRFEGWVQEVGFCSERRFHSSEELLKFLGERFEMERLQIIRPGWVGKRCAGHGQRSQAIKMTCKEERMSKCIAEEAGGDSSEKEVIRQAQQGDAIAFEHLYKKHCKHVYSVCLRMIKNPTEAEDLTQQAFVQLFRKIGTFRGELRLATWLHKVTVNVVLMHIRRKKPTEILSTA